MREHVQACRSGDRRRKRAGVVRVQQAQRRLEPAVGDAGLGMHLDEVEDRDSGGLAARAGRRRDRDQGLQRPGDGHALSDGRIHVVEKIRRVGRVQIGCLGRVDRRSPAHCDERFGPDRDRRTNCLLEGPVRRLDLDPVVDGGANAGILHRGQRGPDRMQVAEEWVRQQQDVSDAPVNEVGPQLARDPRRRT